MGGGYDPGSRKTGGDTQGFSSLLDEVSQHRFQRREAGQSELFPGGRVTLGTGGPRPWLHPGRCAVHKHLLQGVHKEAVKGKSKPARSPSCREGPDSNPAASIRGASDKGGLVLYVGWGEGEPLEAGTLPKPHRGYFHSGWSLKLWNLEP